MFQHAAASSHMLHSGGEATSIVSGSVVLAAPSGEVHGAEIAPQLAGRMSHDRKIPVIFTGVSFLWPCIYEWQASVAAARLHEQRRHPKKANKSVVAIAFHGLSSVKVSSHFFASV